ncbi:MAG: HAMP domain-containing sensor histidine kinase [Candidatus Taylorbacteria bacterium]
MEDLYCSLAVPQFATFFDFSFAPTLLFYAYLPVIVISLFLGFYILLKDNYSLQSKLFFGISISFSLWVLNIIVQWVGVYGQIVHFSWQISAILEIFIPIFVVYFIYVFVEKRDASYSLKYFFSLVIVAVTFLTPYSFNMQSFDLANCESNVGPLLYGVYGFEILSIFWIIMIGIKGLRGSFAKNEDKDFKGQILFLISGASIFLGLFAASNIFGEVTQIYQMNLVGPLGMVLFLAFLSYLIVKFKTFHIKLLATQVFVFSLCALLFALIFINEISISHIVVGVTLFMAIILSVFLVRSVQKEVEQREKIEKLNEQLEGLVHFISHEIKGYLSKSASVFAGIIDEDFGPISPELKNASDIALKANRAGVETIMTILNSANVKKGTMTFTMAPFDIKASVLAQVEEMKPTAEARGLKLDVHIENADYLITGDKEQLEKHVIRNLIDNSVRYTMKGSVTVSLKRLNDKILFTVKDTGIGITLEDKGRLFTEGGRGIESVKVNVASTGYGLFFAKGIVEKHGGRIWAESEGADKGATFFVELPIKKAIANS